MCLERIKKVYKRPTSGVGWKVFELTNEGLRGEFHSGSIPTKRWLTKFGFRCINGIVRMEKELIEGVPPYAGYKEGFHIFRDEVAAKYWCGPGQVVRKVKFRKGHTFGFQGGRWIKGRHIKHWVIVADEIYVHPRKGDV